MPTPLHAARENAFSPTSSAAETGPRLQRVLQAQRNLYLGVKHGLDFVLALFLFILTGPIILLCALLVRLTSRGPAFYSQIRLGQGGRPYRIYKLRTMYHLSEAQSGPQWSQVGDPRVTLLGRFLRRTHLDELPQLWNILRGEMSLVGPRPERPEFVLPLTEVVPLYPLRMLVRPGVTGLAQVQAPADTDVASVRTKVSYDLHYIWHVNLWLDLRLLVATGFKVIGASFGFLCKAFALPARAVVESHYLSLQQGTPQTAATAAIPDVSQPTPELIPVPDAVVSA
jgi:lipopolysaccharide/colanic/teichoic acid biosynthesis glycosyltransferase